MRRVGRLNMARLSAEEQILAETVLIPGPRAQEDEEEQDLEENEPAAWHLEMMRERTRMRQEDE